MLLTLKSPRHQDGKPFAHCVLSDALKHFEREYFSTSRRSDRD